MARTRELLEDLCEVVVEALVRGDEHCEAVLVHLLERLGWVDPPLVENAGTRWPQGARERGLEQRHGARAHLLTL